MQTSNSLYQERFPLPYEIMVSLLRGFLTTLMVGFNVLSIQAHLTSRFTPGFSKNLAEKLPQHNRVLFGWLHVTETSLRALFVSINLLLSVMLLTPSLRILGMKIGFGLCCVGFYSDMKLGESPIPHLTLFTLASVGLWLG